MVLTLFININRNSKVGQLNETDARHIVRSNFAMNFIKKWSHLCERNLFYAIIFFFNSNKQRNRILVQIHDMWIEDNKIRNICIIKYVNLIFIGENLRILNIFAKRKFRKIIFDTNSSIVSRFQKHPVYINIKKKKNEIRKLLNRMKEMIRNHKSRIIIVGNTRFDDKIHYTHLKIHLKVWKRVILGSRVWIYRSGTAIGPDEFRGIGGPHRSLHLMV